jgi:diaminopimelate decarboxylase
METPYLILDKKQLIKNYQEFENLCKKHLKNFQIAYSLKTNTNKEIIDQLKNLNSGFESASLNEINLIKKFKTFKIFNGPAKTKQELEIALKSNFYINIDSLSEIDKISKIIKNKKITAGIRISSKENKFGFNKNEILNTINYAKSKNIEINGIHIHSGTQQSLEKFKNNLKEYSELIKILPNITYVDIGGGFPDKSQLKNLNQNLEDFIIEIKQAFPDKTIIFEPGRNLVADSMELITKVIAIKTKNNQNYAILDAGINILPKITLANYKFTKIPSNLPSPNPKKQYILTGPLLFSNDTLGKITENLHEGDLIKVENVGAYCYNLAWTISYDKPKVYIK